MINFHPDEQMLYEFAHGNLSTSISVAVSIHVEMCEECRNKVAKFTDQIAAQEFSSEETADQEDFAFEDMISSITQDASKDKHYYVKRKSYQAFGQDYPLPQALNSLELGNWQSIGHLARSRVNLDDGDVRSSILKIDAGGDVPEHTHNGFELTLLLDGSFSDEMGTYHKGDFILLDDKHQHQPTTENGCICYTVVSDSLHFTQGVSRLLNPIGKLIY